VPFHYNRAAPGTYQQDQTLLSDPQLENLTKHTKPTRQIIGKEDFPQGAYLEAVPHHRFTDYSKSQMNSQILLNKEVKIQNRKVKANKIPGINIGLI